MDQRGEASGPFQATQARIRRLGVFMLFALLGVIVTLATWWSAMRDSNHRAASNLTVVAREIHAVLNVRIDRHIEALHNLALFWQLHGLMSRDAWDFNAQMLIQNFRGLEWIGWVDAKTGATRFSARDSTARFDPEVIRMARGRSHAPGSESVYGRQAGDPVLLFTPVRTPDDSVGVLVASLSPAKLLGHENLTIGEIIAYSVKSDGGAEVYRWGEPAPHVPDGMTIEMNLPEVFGRMWVVRYEPTQKYLQGIVSRWHNYFLLTGVLLSIALGGIAYQFMRLREYSSVLAAQNRRLDAQVRELSERDQRLRKMNDELEARVEARTNQLAEAINELEAFSHSMSHDLRSPIGAILNYTSILEEDYHARLDDEGRRLLHRIRHSGQSATRLLDQLVQFVWMGRETGETGDVDMTGLAREAFQEVTAGRGGTRDISFELHDLPPVRGNAALLGRVFRNLLSNAVKYTHGTESPRIVVRGEEKPSEAQYSVEDNGIGFDSSQAESLFEPFRRLHSSNEYEGAGLGLAIVAKIVRRHGGRVWAESNGNGGARFGFALPREGSRG
jgi:signal transduction histidine kinase